MGIFSIVEMNGRPFFICIFNFKAIHTKIPPKALKLKPTNSINSSWLLRPSWSTMASLLQETSQKVITPEILRSAAKQSQRCLVVPVRLRRAIKKYLRGYTSPIRFLLGPLCECVSFFCWFFVPDSLALSVHFRPGSASLEEEGAEAVWIIQWHQGC